MATTENFTQLYIPAPYAGVSNYVVLEQFVTKNGANIDVTMKLRGAQNWPGLYPGFNSTFDFTMDLQRFDGSIGNFRTIASRTGYVSLQSPANRTFTNVGGYGLATVVRMTLKGRLTGRTHVVTTSPFAR